MSAPRGLSAEEAEAWEKLTATVAPLHPRAVRPKPVMEAAPKPPAKQPPAKQPPKPKPRRAPAPPAPPPKKPEPLAPGRLDLHWDKRLKTGVVQPDFTLDLHGYNLESAYDRLIGGVAQARAMDARTILLVTGRPRPVEAADRAERRGAIRAKVLDWLAASHHHAAIAAVRRAHPRHGGEGALYIVLKRER